MSDFEDGDGGNQFQSMGITVVRGQHPTHAIEKIIRERIFDSLYWKEKCFALNAASVLDLAADLTHIGGTFSNQKPTEFLCLTLKLLQLQPEMDIIAEYLNQEDFKYIRALGAFYLRLVGSAATVFQHLEPLLNDFRKLRFRNSDGSYRLTHMDEFVDQLLTEERVCDTILPRLSSREVLEDQDQLEPRQSVLQGDLEPSDSDESDSSIDSRAQYSDRSLPQSPVQSDDEMIPAAKGGRLKLKKPPVEKQKSEGTSSPTTNGGFKEEMSFEETNKLRISLGLKPLQRC